MDSAYIQKKAEEIAAEQAKNGELIRAGLTTYLAVYCDANLSERDLGMMSAAFLAGGVHLFSTVVPSRADGESEQQAISASMRRVAQIEAEIARVIETTIAALPVEGQG